MALLAPLLGLALLAAQDAEPSVAPSLPQRLARHPYFSKLELASDASHPPYRFLVQAPARGGEGRAAAIVAQYAPLLDPLRLRFEREVATPLGLTQRADRAELLLVVLASKGDWTNYQGVTNAAWHLAPGVLFDRALGAAVLYDDVFQPARAAGERAQSARHALVHLCQQAWYAGGTNAPLDSWVLEGQADHWARSEPPAEHAPIDPAWLKAFVADAQDATRRWTNLRTLEELAFVGDALRLEALFRTRTPRGLELDTRGSWWAFYRQASLLMQYLWEAPASGRRPVALALLAQALARAPGDGLAGAKAPELEAEFLAWVRAEQRAHFAAEAAAEAVDEAAYARAFERGPGGTPMLAPPARATPEPAAPPVPEASPPAPPPAEPAPALDLADASPDERFALALVELTQGRTQAAVAALEALLAETEEAAPRTRLERELARARTWQARVESFLDGLAREGGVLEVTLDGKKLRSRVLAFADGELTLERPPGRLRAEALPALELAQAMPTGNGPDEWVRLYPYALCGDARTRKLLRPDGGPATQLLADAKDDYPERLRLGRLAQELGALAARPEPSTPRAARADYEALRAWSDAAVGLALLERKRPALRAFARARLLREAELLGPHTRLAGKFEALDGERVRIRYTFDDARELDDFEPGRYPVMMRKGFLPTEVESEPMHVERGRLRTRGETSLRSLFELGAPLTVRWDFEFGNSGVPGGNDTFGVGVCDDGQEHFLWMLGLAHLQLVDGPASASASGPNVSYFLERSYAAELVHDGQRVQTTGEGLPGPALADVPRSTGALFLFAHCRNELRVSELVIEGRLLPGSFTRLVDAAIERELADD